MNTKLKVLGGSLLLVLAINTQADYVEKTDSKTLTSASNNDYVSAENKNIRVDIYQNNGRDESKQNINMQDNYNWVPEAWDQVY